MTLRSGTKQEVVRRGKGGSVTGKGVRSCSAWALSHLKALVDVGAFPIPALLQSSHLMHAEIHPWGRLSQPLPVQYFAPACAELCSFLCSTLLLPVQRSAPACATLGSRLCDTRLLPVRHSAHAAAPMLAHPTPSQPQQPKNLHLHGSAHDVCAPSAHDVCGPSAAGPALLQPQGSPGLHAHAPHPHPQPHPC